MVDDGSRSPGRSRADRGRRRAPTSSTQRCGARVGRVADVCRGLRTTAVFVESPRCWSPRAGRGATRAAGGERWHRLPGLHRPRHGFVLEPAEAQAWIEADRGTPRCCSPTSTARTSTPDRTARRRDGSSTSTTALRRGAEYRSAIRPSRASGQAGARRNNSEAVGASYWWQFCEQRPAMRKAIADLDEVLVIALVSKTVMPMRVSTRPSVQRTSWSCSRPIRMRSGGSVVEPASDVGDQVRVHDCETDPSYTPSDVFETFPRPGRPTGSTRSAGPSTPSVARSCSAASSG